MAVTEPIFMKLMLACQFLVKNFYTDFMKYICWYYVTDRRLDGCKDMATM